MNLLQKIDKQQVEKMQAGTKIDEFGIGDTVIVNVKVVEGTRERIQAYQGVCIARKNAGINSSFTVRKISYGEGVERVFPLFSPRVESVELVRHGTVRRSKLYYLRSLRGRAARIVERTDYDVASAAEPVAKEAKSA